MSASNASHEERAAAPEYTGLTWDHPRGRDALVEAAVRVNHTRDRPLLSWRTQPLEGFESAPIARLAAENDLLVLDHPHLGEALAEACLTPLEALFPASQIAEWEAACVGLSLKSYQLDGKTWALPLDVATQVMVRRPDRVPEVPDSWDAMEALSHDVPVAMSLGGPHAVLSLISMAMSELRAQNTMVAPASLVESEQSAELAVPRAASITAASGQALGGEIFLPDDVFLLALERMYRLYRQRPVGSEHLNPIQLLEAMACTENIAMCPLVFGYVTYAIPGLRPHRLSFDEAIAHSGVLGGTGIGFCRHSNPSPELLAHLASLLSAELQCGLIPEFGGQPSLRVAWQSEHINAQVGGFYQRTLDTNEHAILRPRFDGYIAFQTQASALLREALNAQHPPLEVVRSIRQLWRTVRHCARGPRDER